MRKRDTKKRQVRVGITWRQFALQPRTCVPRFVSHLTLSEGSSLRVKGVSMQATLFRLLYRNQERESGGYYFFAHVARNLTYEDKIL